MQLVFWLPQPIPLSKQSPEQWALEYGDTHYSSGLYGDATKFRFPYRRCP